MLVLTRNIGEEIVIGGDIRIMVVAVKGNKAQLGITAPTSVPVARLELLAGCAQGVRPLDDHFANRCAAAIGLGKTGRLRQTGNLPPFPDKDVRHAKPFCAAGCTGPRYPKSLAGSYPSSLHAASSGLSLPAHPSACSQRSAV